MREVAQQTYGFSGAHLANLVNEAAIQAMRRDDDCIRLSDFLDSIDKVQLGAAKDGFLTAAEKHRVAIHECGHALVSELYFPESVSTVTVMPRSRTLGFIRQKETSSPVLQTESHLKKQLGVLLAGGAAEEIFFGERSTGSANDYQRALELSENIVAHGLSRLGIVNVDNLESGQLHEVTNEIIQQSSREIAQILVGRKPAMAGIADALVSRERLSGEEFRAMMI